jgi:hypothetical protein
MGNSNHMFIKLIKLSFCILNGKNILTMENLDDLELNRSNDITIDEVKSFPMFAHFSDEEAAEVVRTIKRFTEIICHDYLRNNNDEKLDR